MLNDLLFAAYFFLPAGIANGAPVVVSKFPILKKFNYPLDFNLTYKGKRILGSHKTIRGLIFGILLGIYTQFVLQQAYTTSDTLQNASPIDFTEINFIILGALLGLGAIIGDSMKSLFKRRINIAPGKSWFPFDQLDYIVGGILFSLVYIQLDPIYYLLIFVIYLIVHPISTVIGYFIRVKDSPI